MHSPLKPFAAYSGAKHPKCLLVGEAFGHSEFVAKKPFVGASGKLLFELLGEAQPELESALHADICDQHKYGDSWLWSRDRWFEAASIGLTNVFNFQPPANKIDNISFTKKELKSKGLSDHGLPAIIRGKYLDPQYLPELERLSQEIAELKPNLIVALGNTPCWALLRTTAISSIRGSTAIAVGAGRGLKVLPTYHPAAILYQWTWRTITIADLMKAAREAKFSEIRRPARQVLIDPTIEEVENYCNAICISADLSPSPIEIGADCETVIGQIKMISFAASAAQAIVIPFIDERKVGRSFWPDLLTELRAWAAVRRVCEHRNITLVGQNFIYDMQYICPLGIKIGRTPEDTMMLHHSLYPEMKKSLGFLGSVYTDEASWKLMRNQKPDTEKRDE